MPFPLNAGTSIHKYATPFPPQFPLRPDHILSDPASCCQLLVGSSVVRASSSVLLSLPSSQDLLKPPSYLDLETPAPITPGSFSSPMLNSMAMHPVTRPTRTTVVVAINQNGELTSIFWQ